MNTLENGRFFAPNFILIASSTGGPAALHEVLRKFSFRIRPPIFVVQHMPPKFTATLAGSLNGATGFFAKEAEEKDLVRIQSIMVAPGGKQMLLKKRAELGQIELSDETGRFGLRPSADIFFQSVAASYPGCRVLVIVLTGMGDDGKQGIEILRKSCECYTIVQDAESSVVWGMPGAVYAAGLANEMLPLEEIGERVNTLLNV